MPEIASLISPMVLGIYTIHAMCLCISFPHSFCLSLNHPSHPVCPFSLHARAGKPLESLQERRTCNNHIFCMSVRLSLSRLHFYGHTFRPAALHEDCRLWGKIPGTALGTCASERISLAMSEMCQPRRGCRLLPIFGKSLTIASPQPDWQPQ